MEGDVASHKQLVITVRFYVHPNIIVSNKFCPASLSLQYTSESTSTQVREFLPGEVLPLKGERWRRGESKGWRERWRDGEENPGNGEKVCEVEGRKRDGGEKAGCRD